MLLNYTFKFQLYYDFQVFFQGVYIIHKDRIIRDISNLFEHIYAWKKFYKKIDKKIWLKNFKFIIIFKCFFTEYNEF